MFIHVAHGSVHWLDRSSSRSARLSCWVCSSVGSPLAGQTEAGWSEIAPLVYLPIGRMLARAFQFFSILASHSPWAFPHGNGLRALSPLERAGPQNRRAVQASARSPLPLCP